MRVLLHSFILCFLFKAFPTFQEGAVKWHLKLENLLNTTSKLTNLSLLEISGKDDFASCAANAHVHCATQAQQDLENRVRMCSSTENLIKCYENPEEPYSAKIYTDFVNILQKFASQLRGGMPDC